MPKIPKEFDDSFESADSSRSHQQPSYQVERMAVRKWRAHLRELMAKHPNLDQMSILYLAGRPPRPPQYDDFHPDIHDPDYRKKLRALYPGIRNPENWLDLGYETIFNCPISPQSEEPPLISNDEEHGKSPN